MLVWLVLGKSIFSTVETVNGCYIIPNPKIKIKVAGQVSANSTGSTANELNDANLFFWGRYGNHLMLSLHLTHITHRPSIGTGCHGGIGTQGSRNAAKGHGDTARNLQSKWLQATKRAPEGALRSFIIVSNETLSSLVRLLSSLMRIYDNIFI